MKAEKRVQYACAVTLIVSSILMAGYQVFSLADVANGTLLYIAQAFLLAGSIFGLDYYVQKITDGRQTPPPTPPLKGEGSY